MANIAKIMELYTAYFNRAADKDGVDYWANEMDTKGWTLDDVANTFAQQTEYTALYAGKTNAEIVALVYTNVLNRTAETDGATYWETQLTNGAVTVSQLIQAVVNAATEKDANGAYVHATDAAIVNNKTEVSQYAYDENSNAKNILLVGVTEDKATTQSAKTSIDAYVAAANKGQTYDLTSGTDKLVGTDKNDFFDASIVQNSFTGGVSNSLSSADKLDGGAGTDTLHAEIVPEFFGATGDNQIDIQPKTTSIEIVTFEARDAGSNAGATGINNNTVVTVDAKYMTGVQKIGSKNSDGDLIIENLTTLTDAGVARNTDSITITMDHTDNFNSDTDASDLTVYFDEDYLLTGETTSGATLTIRLINAVQNEAGNNPVDGFSEIKFKVGDTEVVVDITSVANDASQDFTTAYAAIVDLINDELKELGFTDVTASAPALEDAVFSIPVAGFTTGDDAGDYYPIIVKNEGKEPLIGVNIATSALQYDTDLNNSFSTVAPETNNDPVSVNVELHKVGREGEGGNLIIGGKELDLNTPNTTEGNGIDTFNISVLGNESKLSNLGTILSTNGALRVVNIASEARTDNNYASLTVRDAFGGTLETLNANNFKGDLLIGTDTAANNIDTFTATGGGDVTLNEVISQNGTGGGSFASLDNNVYTVTTGAGSDTINVDANSGAQLTISTGAGSDTITVSIDGQDDSGSDLTKAFIVSTSGNNTVEVTSTDSNHEADITLGSGADTVTGNSVNITVSTGAGNDTIYTNNTGTKAIIINTVADNSLAGTATSIAGTTGAPATPDQSELLYGRTVVVTLATAGIAADEFVQGYESISVDIEASNGYLTTTTDLHKAIAKAINTDPVLSKLAEASVDSNGTLTVSYLIDGAITVGTNAALEYTISGVWSDLTTIEQNAILTQLEKEYTNSDLILANVGTAYDTAAITTAKAILDNGSGTDGVDSTDTDINTVNAGLGNDVIVLSSATGIDTIEIDANGFGNDTIVHFEVGAGGDIFDFAHLNNVTSLSGSTVSQIDVAGTVATATTITANSLVQVALTSLTDNDAVATTAMTFDSLTSNGVLAEINASPAGEFAIGALPANLVGDKVNSIFMVEDDANAGYYKVFEVVYNTTSSTFTEATLVGTLDFEQSVTLHNDNIA